MRNFFKSIFGENKSEQEKNENETSIKSIVVDEKEVKLNAGLGIEFGISRDSLIEEVLKKGGNISELEIEHGVCVENLKFIGKKTEFVLFIFADDKLCKSAYYIKPELDPYIFDLYDEIKERIGNKYHKADKEFEYYKDPYFKGDGYEIQAISNGLGNIASYWFFKEKENKNILSLSVTTNIEIEILFENEILMNVLTNKLDSEYEADL